MLNIYKNKSILTANIILVILIILAVFADYIAPYSPYQQNLTLRLLPISNNHWFGTDELGRDIFSRVIFGTRYAFYIVISVTVLAAPLGLFIGTMVGYFAKNLIGKIILRIIDIFLAFPKLILALALVAALGPGINNAILAIVITAWAPYARLAMAKTLSIMQQDFILALKLQGAGDLRMILVHIMPLITSTIMLQASLDMGGFILMATGLSFLGLGAQPPLPEWGAMIASGREYILNQWWLITFPGMAIAILALGFNLLGESLRDVYDPIKSCY